MDAATIARLESSFNLLAARGEELVDRFYAHLFSRHPELKTMFPGQMHAQKKKLLTALVLVMQNLRMPDKLRGPLVELGRQHAGHGAKSEHYPIIRDALIGVIAEMLGKQWNEQLTADWRTAFGSVTGVMLEGQMQWNAAPTA